MATQGIKTLRNLFPIARGTFRFFFCTVVFNVPQKAFKLKARFLFYFPRYITVAYFLNDVDDGGEVVLPLANSKFEVFHLMLHSFVF